MMVVVVKPRVLPTLSALEMMEILEPMAAGLRNVVLIS
jgi:hypothetical protein